MRGKDEVLGPDRDGANITFLFDIVSYVTKTNVKLPWLDKYFCIWLEYVNWNIIVVKFCVLPTVLLLRFQLSRNGRWSNI